MAAATDPFVLVEDLSGGDAQKIDQASSMIRAYCRWHIWPLVEATLILDSPGRSVLFLPTLALAAVTAVELLDPAGVEQPVALTFGVDYTWSAMGRLTRQGESRCPVWPAGDRCVQVTFNHGHTEVPAEVASVTVALAKRLPAAGMAIQQEAAGSVSHSFAIAAAGVFTELEKQSLAGFRLVRA